jgi:hypothetical protein
MHLFEGRPGQLGTGFGDCTAMYGFRFGPQATASGMAEKCAGFAVNALAFTAGGEGEQKDEKDGKRQFALTNKGFGGKMEVFRGKTVRNELKKIIQNG